MVNVVFRELAKNYNRLSKIPKYLQIREAIRSLIDSGNVYENQMLPTEKELCQIFDVSRMTIRQAIDELVREGLLERRSGDGTFVKSLKITGRLKAFASFSDEQTAAGKVTHTKVLSIEVLIPKIPISKKLKRDRDSRVIEIKRLRYVDEYPISLQVSYFPYETCKPLLKADLSKSSIYSILYETTGIEISNVTETIQAVNIDEASASLLDIATADACFLLCRVLTSKDREQHIEYVESILRGDKYMFINEFRGKEV